MGLNIKNEETHRLAVQLAVLTGETMTQAVTMAIKERIERVQRQRNIPEILARAQE
jgi:antitoxin VapB